jgi:hypothetical protein
MRAISLPAFLSQTHGIWYGGHHEICTVNLLHKEPTDK